MGLLQKMYTKALVQILPSITHHRHTCILKEVLICKVIKAVVKTQRHQMTSFHCNPGRKRWGLAMLIICSHVFIMMEIHIPKFDSFSRTFEAHFMVYSQIQGFFAYLHSNWLTPLDLYYAFVPPLPLRGFPILDPELKGRHVKVYKLGVYIHFYYQFDSFSCTFFTSLIHFLAHLKPSLWCIVFR